jgi:hypothetical protein
MYKPDMRRLRLLATALALLSFVALLSGCDKTIHEAHVPLPAPAMIAH